MERWRGAVCIAVRIEHAPGQVNETQTLHRVALPVVLPAPLDFRPTIAIFMASALSAFAHSSFRPDMAPSFKDIAEEARISARALLDFADNLVNPTVRLGVTGLSRAGKTVFITALVHGLVRGGRFPVFESLATGRIARARLAPQPDDAVPRFDYETHLRDLIEERRWPDSTSDISELRLVIDYQRQNGADKTLTLDIVDYPGEWLLDLPLLHKTYEQWSAESLLLSRQQPRARVAEAFHAHLATLDPNAAEDEAATRTAATLFTEYLRACRDERFAMSLLPPGRFLMPGNLRGSPALTFAPLVLPADLEAPDGSLWAMMRRRFEAYKDVVVRPFFRDHFARLDRQIVLVDALSAFNAGPEALHDLAGALAGILDCFRIGRSSLWSALWRPRIDRILFAATKADHLHHTSHDRLEAILRRTVDTALGRSEMAGAAVDVVALSAVRATKEAQVQRGRDRLPSILGTPMAGEVAGDESFDGNTEVATFPGDLPTDLDALFSDEASFRGLAEAPADSTDYRFLKFRPPALERSGIEEPALPHIRLDRALQFLIGDRLQ
jgi:predicted YcjX-like family ATPase